MKKALTVSVLMLMACATLYYSFFIFDPMMRSLLPVGPAFGSDFYPRWEGMRAMLLRHENPYSEDVSERIQRGYYGRIRARGEHLDPQRFAYPAHLTVLLAPLAVLNFSVARATLAVSLGVATA